jgi:hypothetical protein
MAGPRGKTMPRKCLVCESQETRNIDEMLVNRVSISEISRTFKIPYHSIDRHKKNHVSKTLTKAKHAEEVTAATSLLGRVERIMARCESIAEAATRERDWSPAIAASRELRGCLELLGRLSGELQRGTQVGIQIVSGVPAKMVAVGSPEWEESFREYLDALLEDEQ